jgi:DNA-binding XRE family transcriptional regulator
MLKLKRCQQETLKIFQFAYIGPMITSAQIRAGRGLLKWTQATLAAQAAVSIVTLNMIETEQVTARERTLTAIRRALESGGVRFIGDDETGRGVLLDPGAATR